MLFAGDFVEGLAADLAGDLTLPDEDSLDDLEYDDDFLVFVDDDLALVPNDFVSLSTWDDRPFPSRSSNDTSGQVSTPISVSVPTTIPASVSVSV